MFQKVRLKLSLLCAGITIIIMAVMSLSFLFVSEKSLRENNFLSFQSDMNTLLSNLEQQTVITHEWLSKLEGNGKYSISIIDNDVEFLFNSRDEDEAKTALFEKAWKTYYASFIIESITSPYSTHHVEFTFNSEENNNPDYYACAAISERSAGQFKVMILSSLTGLESQITRQRMIFLILNLAAAAALTVFSWYFTKRLLDPLEESQRSQIEFVASASHELRTPLAVIISALSAASKAATEAEKAGFMNTIHSECMRLSRLVNDMLTLARADNHSWNIHPEPVELDTLVLNSFESFEQLAIEKQLTLKVRLPEDSVTSYIADKERITQVLAILLHNAISYTPKKGIVILSLTEKKESFEISVSDNGPGIPDSEKEKIFKRFYRSDSARTKKDHFGLGLCIAYEITAAHNGSIMVTDTPDGGATFVLMLRKR